MPRRKRKRAGESAGFTFRRKYPGMPAGNTLCDQITQRVGFQPLAWRGAIADATDPRSLEHADAAAAAPPRPSNREVAV
jgi:hypothetical protein